MSHIFIHFTTEFTFCSMTDFSVTDEITWIKSKLFFFKIIKKKTLPLFADNSRSLGLLAFIDLHLHIE